MLRINQAQISDYARCERLYYLKHVEHRQWPYIPIANPFAEKGNAFHELVQRHILGIPDEILLNSVADNNTKKLFEIFLAADPLRGYDIVIPECNITAVIDSVLIECKYDVLAAKDDRITIFDWKTTKKSVKASDCRKTPQTRLYCLLAETAAEKFTESGSEIFPSGVQMIYWFPEHPDKPVILPYNEELHEQDLAWLKMTKFSLSSSDKTDYPKQDNMEKCADCLYCTYCHPGAAVYPYQAER